MGSIYIKIEKDNLVSFISDKSSNTPNEFQRIVDDIKETIGINLTIESPVDQGNLVSGNMIIENGPYSFYTDNEMSYYPFVVKGTNEHWIGSPVFINSIGEFRYIGMHPGTAPNDFPQRALEDSESDIMGKCEEFLSWIVS